MATTRWGRIAGGTLAVLMLADASWGADGVGLPLLGWPVGVVVALVVGGREWRRRRPYVARVEDAVRSAVSGYTRTHLPSVSFSEGPMGRMLGRWLPGGSFAFRVPPEVRGADVIAMEQHLRERLPAAHGTSWVFEWDLRVGVCRARVAPDLPASVWHPYADGSAGNPRSPEGDPNVIPLGMAMGGVEIVWTPRTNPHLLAVGTTGGGKSGVIRTVMEHLLLHRDSWEIRLIDPKYTEFAEYGDYPGAVDGVALTLEESLRMMQEAKDEMTERQRALSHYRVQNIDELNALFAREGQPKLRRMMLVIDEVAELLDRSGGKSDEAKEQDAMRDECSAIVDSIARLGRAMGVHMLYATQRNDAKLISGQTRNNTQARIAVGRLSPQGSQMALENDLATGLSGAPGRGIFFEFGQCRELQVYRTDMEQIRDMIGGAA